MSSSSSPASPSPKTTDNFRLTPRWIVAICIVAVSAFFILSNTQPIPVNFLWYTLTAPGWAILTTLFAAGLISGWMLARSRYKS